MFLAGFLAVEPCRRSVFQLYFSCAGLQEHGRLHSPTEVDFKNRRRESGLSEDLRLPEVKRHRWKNLRGWEKLDENLMQSAANSSLFCIQRVREQIKDSTCAELTSSRRQSPPKGLFTLPKTDAMQPSLLFLPSLDTDLQFPTNSVQLPPPTGCLRYCRVGFDVQLDRKTSSSGVNASWPYQRLLA